MNKQDTLLALARLGATSRIQELERELIDLRAIVNGRPTAPAEQPQPRRGWSPAQRKAAALRMKAYWASKRSGKTQKPRQAGKA